MIDPIIDRSLEQKQIWLEKTRTELARLGFSIVETEWLRATLLANRDRETVMHGRTSRRYWKSIERNEQAAG